MFNFRKHVGSFTYSLNVPFNAEFCARLQKCGPRLSLFNFQAQVLQVDHILAVPCART